MTQTITLKREYYQITQVDERDNVVNRKKLIRYRWSNAQNVLETIYQTNIDERNLAIHQWDKVATAQAKLKIGGNVMAKIKVDIV